MPRIVIAAGLNVYEWIQSQAIKPPQVPCKRESSTSSLHHVSPHNPIWGVWAAIKWPVALLITLAALLRLRPTFIKWATCLFFDVIRVCCWDKEQSTSLHFVKIEHIFCRHYVLFAVQLFSFIWLFPVQSPPWQFLDFKFVTSNHCLPYSRSFTCTCKLKQKAVQSAYQQSFQLSHWFLWRLAHWWGE